MHSGARQGSGSRVDTVDTGNRGSAASVAALLRDRNRARCTEVCRPGLGRYRSGVTMNSLRTGWQVVCPDGEVRLHPYGNLGDAKCDARVVERRGCMRSTVDGREIPCPGGSHDVRPHMFQPAPPVAMS